MAFDINGRIRIDSRDVRDASQNFGELRNRMRSLADEIPGLGAGLSALEGLFGGLRVGSGGSAAALLSVGAAAAAAAVALSTLGVAAAFSWVDKIGAMNDMADKLGITGDQAYYLNQAMTGAGLSVDILLTATDKLSRNMTKSGDDTKGAGLAFERLGVETTKANGELRASGDVLDDLLEKYDMHNLTAQQVADLTLTVGKNFREVAFAKAEAAKAQTVYNEMVEAGIGTSNYAIQVEDEMAMAHLRASGVISQMGSILVEMVIPAWNELTQWFVQSYKEGGTVAQTFNVIANATKLVVEALSFLIKIIGTVIESFILLGKTGFNVMKGIGQALTLDFSGGLSTINGAIDGFGKKLQDIGTRQVGIIKNGVVGIAQATANLLTNKDVVGGARFNMLLQTGGKAGSVLPAGGGAGGRANPTKEAKEGKSQAEKDAEAAQKAIDSLIKSLNGQALATENLNKVEITTRELQDAKYKGISNELRLKALSIAGIIDEANANKILTEATKAVTKSSNDYVRGLEDEVKFRGMNKRDIAEIQELRKEEQRTTEAVNKLRESGLWTLERETQLLEANRAARERVKDATAAVKAQDEDWLGNGVNNYLQGLGTMEEASTKLVENGLKGIENGLMSMITGTEFSFKSFVKTIIDGILQMIIQFEILKPILDGYKAARSGGEGIFGAIGSGIMGLFGNQGMVFDKAMAQGGVLGPGRQTGWYGGQSVLGGESGDEALMPLKRDAAGTLGVMVTGGKGSGGDTYHFAPQITVSGASESRENQEQLAATIKSAIQKEFNENFAKANRPGGMNNRASLSV